MSKRNKRGNNEGSIYQRSDGRWCAIVTTGINDRGKPDRKYFYGKTRADAHAKMVEFQRDMQKGVAVLAKRQTVKEFLERWLEDCVKPSNVPSTYASYAGHVRNHFVPAFGRVYLDKLTAQQIQAFLNTKRKSGLSPRTVQYLRATLPIALNQALEWELVSRNVVANVRGPKVTRFEIHPLSPEEARLFLNGVQSDRLAALYTVAMAVGLRQGEAPGLRWQDVDLEQGILNVRLQLQRIDGKLQLVEPKTSRSRRTIALPDVAVTALRKHKIRQLEERLVAGTRWREHGLIFTTTIGTPLDGSSITRQFKKAVADVGLPHQRFHDLRHCCASLLLAQEVHPRVVMETLGHSTIGLTMNVYSHVMPAAQREAANSMDAILRSTS